MNPANINHTSDTLPLQSDTLSLQSDTLSLQSDTLPLQSNTLPLQSNTSQNIKFTTLVMAAGGTSGIYYLGALQYLLNSQMVDFKNIIGSSAGAAIGYLISIGLYPHDIIKIMQTNMKSIVPLNNKLNIPTLLKKGGCYKNNLVHNLFLKTTLAIHRDVFTFKTLYEKFQINFVVTAYNYTLGRAEFFSHKETPNMDVITAVCMSCNVPFLYTMVSHNNYKYTDGCVASAFPIDYVFNVLGVCDKSVIGLRCMSPVNADESLLSLLQNLVNRFSDAQFDLIKNIYKDRYTLININILDIKGAQSFATVSTMNIDDLYRMIDHAYNVCKLLLLEKH